MSVEVALPALGIVVLTAAIDSVNPCAIGVLILLLTTLLAARKSRNRMLTIGLIYIAAVYVTYFLAGLGLILVLSRIPLYAFEYISIIVGTLIIGAGLIEIKDYFWYGQGFSLMISPKQSKHIHEYVTRISVAGAIVLGVFAAGVELPCTGGPYLAITLLLSQNFNLSAMLLLIVYNIVFVMPLVFILLMTYAGMKEQRVKAWKQKNKKYMRLMTGITMILLGWFLMLIANGTINLA